MDFVIKLLEKEKKIIAQQIHEEDLMHKNMKEATLQLKRITEIKKAIKVLKAKSQY